MRMHALVAAVLLLAGSLGPSWFAVLEALQNANSVLTTRGTLPGPVQASLNTGAAAGTLTKCGVAQAEGHAGVGQGSSASAATSVGSDMSRAEGSSAVVARWAQLSEKEEVVRCVLRQRRRRDAC